MIETVIFFRVAPCTQCTYRCRQWRPLCTQPMQSVDLCEQNLLCEQFASHCRNSHSHLRQLLNIIYTMHCSHFNLFCQVYKVQTVYQHSQIFQFFIALPWLIALPIVLQNKLSHPSKFSKCLLSIYALGFDGFYGWQRHL